VTGSGTVSNPVWLNKEITTDFRGIRGSAFSLRDPAVILWLAGRAMRHHRVTRDEVVH
jgi:hypothetical protein